MKNLLRKLVQADSTSEKGESAVADIICGELRRFGIDVHVNRWDQNRANLTAEVRSAGRKGGLLFACHLDVVPAGAAGWSSPAFSGVESNGKIYGRGSADMKGGITAVVTAIRQIVDSNVKLQGDIVLFGAAGEESDSCGAGRFIADYGKKLPVLAGVVLPEPTDFDVVTTHRGMLWLEVTTKGKAAHGSMPELGINAITSMGAILGELNHYKIQHGPHRLLGECSMSVNTIVGGKEINVVPDKCSIGIDVRTLPGQDYQGIIDDLRNMFAKVKSKSPQVETEVRVVREVGALETDPNCGFVKDFCSAVEVRETKAVGFTTDGPHLASLGAPVVIFGPGKPEVCHKPDEYIDIADVERAVEYYKNIILKFLA
ncbi:MAG: M20 family metallopeptidase [Planctomycetota bacterium]|jgi:succinyl-diaminopimelate desuccinylase